MFGGQTDDGRKKLYNVGARIATVRSNNNNDTISSCCDCWTMQY